MGQLLDLLGQLRSVAATVGEGLVRLVYPNLCWVCQQPREVLRQGICPTCTERLTYDPHTTCPRCSSTVGPYTATADGCSQCRDVSYAFNRALRLGPYEGLLRDTVLRLKARGGEDLAEAVAALLARHVEPRLRPMRPTAVVPIPLHWGRRWRRGFNQSRALAEAVARQLGLPCQPAWLRRARRTLPQTRQTPAQRRDNVRGAFQARTGLDLHGQSIVLVDDVLTTGATAHEAARALRAAHADQVVVTVLAHGR